MEQLRLLKKKQFGSSIEQTAEQLDGQMSLMFNEAEAYSAPPGMPKTTQVVAHTRKKSGSVKDVVPDHIRVVECWAHARRKFDEALNALPPDKRQGTAALTGLEYCNKLFAWEERFKDLSPKERTKQRLKEERPILDALLAWADSVSAAPKSALGKALHYLKEQWPYLLRYLEDGRLGGTSAPGKCSGGLQNYITCMSRSAEMNLSCSPFISDDLTLTLKPREGRT